MSYIPHMFKFIDLEKWNTKFHCSNKISMKKVVSLFSASSTKNCVGFVSETGAEILCCSSDIFGANGDAWVSIRSSHLPDKLEVNSFCKWLRKRGCSKKR
jgi:hypothetical protein